MYPIYVFALAPLVNREQSHPARYIFLVLSLFGVYLIVSPRFDTVDLGDLLALISGVTAAAVR